MINSVVEDGVSHPVVSKLRGERDDRSRQGGATEAGGRQSSIIVVRQGGH